MHGEAGGVSEGERSHSEEKKDEDVSPEKKETVPEAEKVVPATSAPLPEPEVEPERTHQASGDEKEADETTDVAQETSEPERPTSTTPSQPSKRRSRSRSRSRGSKDMRAKLRQQLEMVSQTQADIAGGSNADDIQRLLDSPSPQLPTQQTYLMQLQLAAAAAQAPPIIPPLSPFGYATPGASAGIAAMPSLQALQTRHLQGLFRSNSAAARMMAMSKLTGEPLDFGSGALSGSPGLGPSTSPSPGPARRGLTRNNTVAGEERVAARQQLLRRLNERIQERGDLDLSLTSEDASSTGTLTPKSRRRRSRRKSNSGVVDDRDGLNTPALKELYPPLIALPPSRTPSVPLERQVTPDPQSKAALRTRTPTPLLHHQYDSPMAHRGPVVEEEDDDPIPTPPRPTRAAVQAGISGASVTASASASTTSLSHETGLRAPLVLSDEPRSLLRQDTLPKSPFERPREEPPDEEQERVLYGSDASRKRKAANDLLDREISWVADPG